MVSILSVFFVLMITLSGCQKTSARTAERDHNAQAEETPHAAGAIRNLATSSIGNMVFVKGGVFLMGDSYNADRGGIPWTVGKDNKPAHKVLLESYYIGKHEVTYQEHDIFATATRREPSLKVLEKLNIRPSEASAGVSWFDAKDYCLWLGDQTGLPFDLPTEAQWEYAARSCGEDVYAATDNGEIEPGRNYPEHTTNAISPGQFPSNPLGLYDMSGNVIEWVNDWYDPTYYQNSPKENPRGPESGELKIKRGGSFLESPEGGNVYTRQEMDPKTTYKNVGFRCALNISDPPEVFKKRAQQILEKLQTR